MSSLPDFKPNFPSWKTNNLPAEAKNLDESGIDLLQKTLIYDPAKRYSNKLQFQHVDN